MLTEAYVWRMDLRFSLGKALALFRFDVNRVRTMITSPRMTIFYAINPERILRRRSGVAGAHMLCTNRFRALSGIVYMIRSSQIKLSYVAVVLLSIQQSLSRFHGRRRALLLHILSSKIWKSWLLFLVPSESLSLIFYDGDRMRKEIRNSGDSLRVTGESGQEKRCLFSCGKIIFLPIAVI